MSVGQGPFNTGAQMSLAKCDQGKLSPSSSYCWQHLLEWARLSCDGKDEQCHSLWCRGGDHQATTPFSIGCNQLGVQEIGGKLDDIAVSCLSTWTPWPQTLLGYPDPPIIYTADMPVLELAPEKETSFVLRQSERAECHGGKLFYVPDSASWHAILTLRPCATGDYCICGGSIKDVMSNRDAKWYGFLVRLMAIQMYSSERTASHGQCVELQYQRMPFPGAWKGLWPAELS